MFATQVLPETLSDDDLQEDNVSEVIGFLIVKEKEHEVKKGVTKIGRDSSMCLIVIENSTISKVHAVIESEGIDDTFIYDAGSTNQTKLGKKVLKPHCRYKLENESKLTLGNIIAKFILPLSKSSHSALETRKLNSENLNPLDELGDIFELATQVTTPDTSTSKISVFEKLSGSNSGAKVPTLILPERESPSKNVFDKVTQCRLDSQEITTKTVFQNSLFEGSNIFNLSTQCQLDKSQTQEIKCKENDKDGDKIKSWLNDGQDDVLCVFMSLHSPKEHNNEELLKEIKTEVEDLSEVFDAPTQIQPVIQESVTQTITLLDSINKNFKKDFSNEPAITSIPCRIQSNQGEISENSSSQHVKKEDFIRTQEFNGDKKSVKVVELAKNMSQDEETQLYLGETLDDLSTTEGKDNDEDFILTQSFEAHETRQNTKTTNVVLESEDIEDFIATQMYDVNNERLGSEISNKANTPRQFSDFQCDVGQSLNWTQRNNEDDFIETQVFKDTTDLFKKNEKNFEDKKSGSGNEEDFIATQLVDIPVIKNRDKYPQESRVEESSRESTPDLLSFENIRKDSEDFISTQLFDAPQGQTSINPKSSEQSDLLVFSSFIKEKDECNIAKINEPVTAESSGDETESDLEIILDKTEIQNGKSYKTESEAESNSHPHNMETEENNSNSSYIFELGPGNHVEEITNKNLNQEQGGTANLSDSDETDCEEIAVVALTPLVKREPLEKVEFEETRALTVTLPDNYEEKITDDVWMAGELELSPKFEGRIENGPKSPELSNAHVDTSDKSMENGIEEMEDIPVPTKMKKMEIGVSKSGRVVDFPLKRSLDNKGSDVVPIKKSKIELCNRLLKNSEKKLLRLVQAHDIAQIQPTRTRNSSKMLTTEKNPNKTDTSVINEHPSSRRKDNLKKGNPKKINGDIVSCLTTKKVKTRRTSYREKIKETSPKVSVESSARILRISGKGNRNSASSAVDECPSRNIPIRKSRRISRTRNDEYFTSSCVNVVFTGFGCESLEKIISELGGKRADDLSCGEVVVADKVRRTVKFLCAIGLGLPITSPEWLLSSRRAQKFLNPWNFILKDEESEEKYNFELKTSLERSKKVKLLEGFSIFATKNTKPPVKELLAIVECCGGTPLPYPPDVWPKKTIIVSCMEDQKLWPLPKLRNIKIVHYEFILGGILRQKIDFKTYRLR